MINFLVYIMQAVNFTKAAPAAILFLLLLFKYIVFVK